MESLSCVYTAYTHFYTPWTFRHTHRDAHQGNTNMLMRLARNWHSPTDGQTCSETYNIYTPRDMQENAAQHPRYTHSEAHSYTGDMHKLHCNVPRHTFRDTHMHTETHSNVHCSQHTQRPTLGNTHTQRYDQGCSPTQRHAHSEICVYTDAQKVYTAIHTGAHPQKHMNTEQRNPTYPLTLTYIHPESHTYSQRHSQWLYHDRHTHIHREYMQY